jgi:protein tyrosine phosphatase
MPQLIQRKIQIYDIETERTYVIKHFQSVAWPDHGAPPVEEEYPSMNRMIYNLKKYAKLGGKIVVHCSAGIGRTGTLVGIFNCITTIERQIAQKDSDYDAAISIFGTVRRMREQRWGTVQTRQQYEFMYKYLNVWISDYLSFQEQVAAQES